MAFDLKFLGHSAFEIKFFDKSILIDPFLGANPDYDYRVENVSDIFLTHAHADHLGNAIDIAKYSQSTITAVFELAKVKWTSKVMPEEASGDGCIAFPLSGTSEANAELQLLAVGSENYKFDHWERNGESISTNKLAITTVTPLAEVEASAEYVAVFTAV